MNAVCLLIDDPSCHIYYKIALSLNDRQGKKRCVMRRQDKIIIIETGYNSEAHELLTARGDSLLPAPILFT